MVFFGVFWEERWKGLGLGLGWIGLGWDWYFTAAWHGSVQHRKDHQVGIGIGILGQGIDEVWMGRKVFAREWEEKEREESDDLREYDGLMSCRYRCLCLGFVLCDEARR